MKTLLVAHMILVITYNNTVSGVDSHFQFH